MPSVRTFIAIELTSQVLEALERAQEHLRRGEGGRAGRWVRKESIHLTLRFLGEVSEADLDLVHQTVRRACAGRQPFVLEVAGLGCFPNLRHPRVVWVGVREQTGELAALQSAIEQGLSHQGFAKERRAFRPHLTLARIRKGAEVSEIATLGRAVGAYNIGELAQMKVDRISVIKSDLMPDGAVYTRLSAASLGPAQDASHS